MNFYLNHQVGGILLWQPRKLIHSLTLKINKKEQQKKKKSKKNEGSISSLWDNFKHSNIHIIGVPEGAEKKQEIGNLFEK